MSYIELAAAFILGTLICCIVAILAMHYFTSWIGRRAEKNDARIKRRKFASTPSRSVPLIRNVGEAMLVVGESSGLTQSNTIVYTPEVIAAAWASFDFQVRNYLLACVHVKKQVDLCGPEASRNTRFERLCSLAETDFETPIMAIVDGAQLIPTLEVTNFIAGRAAARLKSRPHGTVYSDPKDLEQKRHITDSARRVLFLCAVEITGQNFLRLAPDEPALLDGRAVRLCRRTQEDAGWVIANGWRVPRDSGPVVPEPPPAGEQPPPVATPQ